MLQNLINHVALVVDDSGSMGPHRHTLPRVFDAEITHLRQRSVDLNQETRLTVYLFGDGVRCLVYDMDVMRMPSLASYYKANDGRTQLRDGVAKAITDMQKLPELYGDHAFLIYMLTDGQENASAMSRATFQLLLSRLPDHWTLAAVVPDKRGEYDMQQEGFHGGCIQIWDKNTQVGLETAGRVFRSSMSTYMDNRAKGVRGSRSFFTADLSGVSQSQVNRQLTEISATILKVNTPAEIRPFVEKKTRRPYRSGSAFYELTKPENIQPQKSICLMHTHSGKIYGGDDARRLLKLPNYEIRVRPGDHGDYRIFVQSTSVNRKLVPGTEVLVIP